MDIEEHDEELENFDFEEEDDQSETNKFNQKEGVGEKSNHKKYKKHALENDSIFKGKRERLDEDGIDEMTNMVIPDRIEIMQGTIVYEETRNPEEYNRLKKLKEKIYNILLTMTDLNFNKIRRKPSGKDFNRYYEIIKENINDNSFSDCEIFVELAYYFSENLFNMFKLLDPDKGSIILNELKEYKNKNNSEDIEDLDFI